MDEYSYSLFEILTMKHNEYTNSDGVETTPLSLIAEPSDRHNVLAVGVSQPFGRSGVRLDYKTSHPLLEYK